MFYGTGAPHHALLSFRNAKVGLGWCDFRALVERPSALAKNDPFLLS